MAIVNKTINVKAPLTAEQIAEIDAAAKMPIIFDDDCPELTDEQLHKFAKLAKEQREQRRKKIISLRISTETLVKAQKLGKGYTSILSRILEKALDNPEFLKQCL